MKSKIIAVAAVIVGLLGGTPGTDAASASLMPAAPHSRLPVVYGLPVGNINGSNFFNPRIRPTGRMYFTADGAGFMVMHSYSSWTAVRGVGTATTYGRISVNPVKYRTHRTAIRFFRVRTHNGHRYFTRVFIKKCANGHACTAYFSPRYYTSWGIPVKR